MATMPTAAYRQKDWRAGRTVVPPMAKARTSVKEVMVMATPVGHNDLSVSSLV